MVLAGDGGDEAFADTNGIIKCLIIKNIYLLKSKTIIIWGKFIAKKYDSKCQTHIIFANNDFLQIDLKTFI